jgi:hypothetical protein
LGIYGCLNIGGLTAQRASSKRIVCVAVKNTCHLNICPILREADSLKAAANASRWNALPRKETGIKSLAIAY